MAGAIEMVRTGAAALDLEPDVTLELDLEGVIRSVNVSGSIPHQDMKPWIGRPWVETVVDPGRAKVTRIVRDARATGVSAFRQVNQRFPDGLELPIEYTAVRSGRKGLIAVGKSMQAVAEMQARLNAAQQAIERDYWRLREVETRCRMLFDRSNDAVLMVRVSDLHMLEANPPAIRALGMPGTDFQDGAGPDLLTKVPEAERATLENMLHRVRDHGRAPACLVHLGAEGQPTLIRASLLPSQEGATYLLQLIPAGMDSRAEESAPIPTEILLERSPDGFVVLDPTGRILRANRAFLHLVQLGDEQSVTGERLERWLGRPGADMTVLLTSISRHGSIRLFSTTLHGELGSGAEVEVAAAGDQHPNPAYLGVLIRDVGPRLRTTRDTSKLGSALGAFTNRIGETSLPLLVKEAVGVVERHYIGSALEMTAGNRTAAAQLLGVSRQSLYAKLNRYASDEDPATPRRDDAAQ